MLFFPQNKFYFQEIILSAEENSALRADLESAKEFIAERDKGGSNGDMDIIERRALDITRRLEESQEELILMEHQREDDRIRLEVSLKESEEWRQVNHALFLSTFRCYEHHYLYFAFQNHFKR